MKAKARKDAEAALAGPLEVYSAFFLAGRPFIGGDKPSIADMRWAATLEFLRAIDYDFPAWAEEYIGRMEEALGDAYTEPAACWAARVEGFVQAWPERDGDIADRINALPKYVAPRDLQEATWNATVIDGDVAEEVEKFKQEPGEDIRSSTARARPIERCLSYGLIDELHIRMFPVLAGSGERLIDGIETTTWSSWRPTRFASGIVVLTYVPKQKVENDSTPRTRSALDETLAELRSSLAGSVITARRIRSMTPPGVCFNGADRPTTRGHRAAWPAADVATARSCARQRPGGRGAGGGANPRATACSTMGS